MDRATICQVCTTRPPPPLVPIFQFSICQQITKWKPEEKVYEDRIPASTDGVPTRVCMEVNDSSFPDAFST